MFVILLMPKSTYHEETDHQGQWCRYRVDHESIRESEAQDGTLLPFRDRVILYADTIEEANLVAIKMAENSPGREVSVLEQVEIYASAIPAVVRKTVTKAGVLPF